MQRIMTQNFEELMHLLRECRVLHLKFTDTKEDVVYIVTAFSDDYLSLTPVARDYPYPAPNETPDTCMEPTRWTQMDLYISGCLVGLIEIYRVEVEDCPMYVSYKVVDSKLLDRLFLGRVFAYDGREM